MLFGRKKAEPRTVLILDIEGGSVAAALARRNEDGTLSILEEHRLNLPLRPHRSAEAMAGESEKLLERLLPEMARTALGAAPADISVFMAPPWGRPNLELGAPEFLPHMQETLRRQMSPYFEAPPKFYTNAGATLGGLRAIAPAEDKYLLAIVTHETTELLLVHNGNVVGHASMPHGINLPLRTLRAHGSMSEAEARSALKLGHPHEPLAAATEAYANEFFAAGRDLFQTAAPTRVWVVSSLGDYFAQALSHHTLGDLFPQGGTVAALRPQHALRHIPDAANRDIFILLEAIFVLYTP